MVNAGSRDLTFKICGHKAHNDTTPMLICDDCIFKLKYFYSSIEDNENLEIVINYLIDTKHNNEHIVLLDIIYSLIEYTGLGKVISENKELIGKAEEYKVVSKLHSNNDLIYKEIE